jgi:deoxyhypusine monooxygenase
MDGDLDDICGRIVDPVRSTVTARMRGIFALKGLGGSRAIDTLGAALRRDPSVLVKHEAAYCLGQMRDRTAIPVLLEALRDQSEDVVVRHESAEALGAIADPAYLPVLDQYSSDTYPQEVYETCRISAARIRCSSKVSGKPCAATAYASVDPAPPIDARSLDSLRAKICDTTSDLFDRYRAMFALRNIGGEAAVAVLCDAMRAETRSALFRHEVAFVLGQMQHQSSVGTLAHFLRDSAEHEMVRHEAAEALGSIATPECQALLHEYREDPNSVVRESVAVALDIAEYTADGSALHYTDTLTSPALILRVGEA